MRYLLLVLFPLLLTGCASHRSPAWVKPLANLPSGPMVATDDGFCYIGADGQLQCLTAQGDIKWKYSERLSTKFAPVVAGKVICVAGAGRLLGFSAADGQRLWTYTLPGAVGPGTSGDDTIIGEGNNALVLLEASDGHLVKRISLGGNSPAGVAPAGISSYVCAVREGAPPDPEDALAPRHTVIQGFLIPSLEEVWMQEGADSSSLTVSDDLAVFVQTKRHSNGTSSEAIAWNVKTGAKAWSWEPDTKKPSLANRPALDGERAVFSYSTGLDASVVEVKDKEQWRLALPINAAGGVVCTPPALTREWALVGEENALIAVDRATGKKAWTMGELEGKAVGTPLVLQDTAYLATDKKKLYAVKLR